MFPLYRLRKYKPLGVAFVVFIFLLTARSLITYFFIKLPQNLILSPSLYKEIIKLKKEKLILQMKIERLKRLKEENRRLRKSLKIFKKTPFLGNLICKEVIGWSPSFWRREVFVEKDEKIKENALVLNEEGFLIGKVTHKEKGYAVITLLNDPQFFLPVFIENKGRALLKGNLENLKLLYVEERQKVRKEDKIWIKEKNFNFPIYIGKIINLRKSKNSFFLDVEVKPFASLSLIEEVFILNGKN
ncbi:MAG: hypothetical protein B6D55_05895 [Candidatus Omnitrophica bacterium 4484_70.2]|nr:MAG: hypothetical protein B6D55_05895 [Candidatus Omnitrophica bacterium 4484_70.2]